MLPGQCAMLPQSMGSVDCAAGGRRRYPGGVQPVVTMPEDMKKPP